jgi:hypothetical protein
MALCYALMAIEEKLKLVKKKRKVGVVDAETAVTSVKAVVCVCSNYKRCRLLAILKNQTDSLTVLCRFLL